MRPTSSIVSFSRKLFFRYIREEIYVFLFTLSLIAISLVQPYLSKILIDSALPSKNFQFIGKIVALIFVLAIGTPWLGLALERMYFGFSSRIERDLRLFLMDHIFHSFLLHYHQKRLGDVVTRLNGDLGAIKSLISDSVPSLLRSIFMLIGVTCILWSMNWKLFLACFVPLPLYAGIYLYFTPKVVANNRVLRVVVSDFYSKFIESIQNIFLTKIYSREKLELQRLKRENDFLIKTDLGFYVYEKKVNVLFGNAMALQPVVILSLGSYFIIQGNFTLGGLIAFLGYVGSLNGPASSLIGLITAIIKARVPVERLDDLLRIPAENRSEIASSPIANEPIKTIELSEIQVKFENKIIIPELSISASSGDHLLITGPSGSGKTTLLNVFCGIVLPDRGKLRINGKQVPFSVLPAFRKRICYLTQTHFLSYGTLRDNMFCDSDDSIISAFGRVNLDSWYNELPMGLDTPVMEAGKNLSEGQKQRLSIARALLRGGDIWLLDEITSALDPENEEAIMTLLLNELRHKIVICVAHRESIGKYFKNKIEIHPATQEFDEKINEEPEIVTLAEMQPAAI
jgi:ATP-binding cassette subfamily B protein